MTILGSEAVVMGPGDIREAHRTGEFVPIDWIEPVRRNPRSIHRNTSASNSLSLQ